MAYFDGFTRITYYANVTKTVPFLSEQFLYIYLRVVFEKLLHDTEAQFCKNPPTQHPVVSRDPAQQERC